MKSIPEQWIRGCVQKKLFGYAEHAKLRMKERFIEDHEVVECILNGKVIEVQTEYEDVHVLFQEATKDRPEIYVVMAAASYPWIVTVCKTQNETWEFINGFLTRRKKK